MALAQSFPSAAIPLSVDGFRGAPSRATAAGALRAARNHSRLPPGLPNLGGMCSSATCNTTTSIAHSTHANTTHDYTSNAPRKPATFFDLPAELRLHIYALCVQPVNPSGSLFEHRFRSIKPAFHPTDSAIPAALAPPVLFADSTFPTALLYTGNKRLVAEATNAWYRAVGAELIIGSLGRPTNSSAIVNTNSNDSNTAKARTTSPTLALYRHFLTTHPIRFAESLTLRVLHDLWTSTRYCSGNGTSAAVSTVREWRSLARLIRTGMVHLKRLTVLVLHDAGCDFTLPDENDVDPVGMGVGERGRGGSIATVVDPDALYAHRGLTALADGLVALQGAFSPSGSASLPFRAQREDNRVAFRVVLAAPDADYVVPAVKERLLAFFRARGLRSVLGPGDDGFYECSWRRLCMQDRGAFFWSACVGTGAVSGGNGGIEIESEDEDEDADMEELDVC